MLYYTDLPLGYGAVKKHTSSCQYLVTITTNPFDTARSSPKKQTQLMLARLLEAVLSETMLLVRISQPVAFACLFGA